MVILDTDHLTLLEWTRREDTECLRARLSDLKEDEKATTVINYEEQVRGWMTYLARTRSVAQEIEAYRRLKRQLEYYCAIKVLDFDERAATEYQRLRKARLRVGTMDLKIAAIVLAHSATLLSRNRSDFGQVPGLKVEDWTT
jgi:tRNA(fMet)-specific endonuclease VapC